MNRFLDSIYNSLISTFMMKGPSFYLDVKFMTTSRKSIKINISNIYRLESFMNVVSLEAFLQKFHPNDEIYLRQITKEIQENQKDTPIFDYEL